MVPDRQNSPPEEAVRKNDFAASRIDDAGCRERLDSALSDKR